VGALLDVMTVPLKLEHVGLGENNIEEEDLITEVNELLR
jgi:hypothetical protein